MKMNNHDWKKKDDEPLPLESALEISGNGVYNMLLALTCGWILLAIGVDLFGFSLVVLAACDLNLTVAQQGILTSLPFIGILLFSYFWGYISDTKGRRFTLVLCMHAGFVLSCLCSISPNWIFLGICKFLAISFSYAANSATYTLVGESCIQRVRCKYILLMTSLIILSPAFGGILAYPTLKLDFEIDVAFFNIMFKPWRLLTIVLALPSGIGAIAIYFFYESPKFLINCGREKEALDNLSSIYAINHGCSKDEFKVNSVVLEEGSVTKKMSMLRSIIEQSAPLFRKPYLWRTLQLFYIVSVVYITNNSFLVWLAHILNLIRVALNSETTAVGNICALISNKLDTHQGSLNSSINLTTVSPDVRVCLGTIEDNVMYTLIASQSVFAFLNIIVSYLQNHRKKVLMTVLCLSSLGGVALNLMPEPISSVFFFVIFTSTCLGMGIMASYFVDLYPTSHRGMVACLSIMAGRSSTFIGINVVGNLIFHHCTATFYFWSILVLSAAVAAYFLPPDKIA